MKRKFVRIFNIFLLFSQIKSRVHNFSISQVQNYRLPISTFGYNKDGIFDANIEIIRKGAPLNEYKPIIGFTFDKSNTIGGNKRMEQNEDFIDALQIEGIHTKDNPDIHLPCILDENEEAMLAVLAENDIKDGMDRITFKIEFPQDNDSLNNNPTMLVWKTPSMQNGIEVINRSGMRNGGIPLQFKNTTFTLKDGDNEVLGFSRSNYDLAYESHDGKENVDHSKLEVQFQIKITDKSAAGFYEFNFHDCFTYNSNMRPDFDINIQVTERNKYSYLSAGLINMPEAYFLLFIMYSVAACAWYSTLVSNRTKTFRIHWLMAVVITVKCMSLLAHSIDDYYISKDGVQHSWAIIFYVIHFIRGVLLFFTLALIATGWSFVKCVLSDNERKVFIIVLPLQIIANVAFTILESSEEASKNYQNWQEIAIFVDLICCGAIMFPIVWSIKHLSMAAGTDGKGVVVLKKLELFKSFYAWTIAYIYLTRIGGLLLDMAIPFNLQWVSEVLKELATLLFFCFTGSLFKPGSENNPYIRLRTGEGDDDSKTTLLQSGAMENMKKRKVRKIDSASDDSETDEEELVDTVALIKAARSPSTQV